MTPPPPATQQDLEHLRLLSIFHYVAGGMLALFACIGFIYIVMGIGISLAPQRGSGGPPPAVFGVLFSLLGGGFVLLGWSVAALLILAGRSLAQHRRYPFCFAMAIVACLWMPLGTVLGVFTIIVLTRPTVQALFGRPVSPP